MTRETKAPGIREVIMRTVGAATPAAGDYILRDETLGAVADAILKEFPSMEAVTLVGDPELELAILHDPIAWHALTIGRFYETRKRENRQAVKDDAQIALRRVLRMDGGNHPCRFCNAVESQDHDPDSICGKAVAAFIAMEDAS